MQIKKLKLKNFAKFTDFECEFDGKVTHLVGVNGSGKTTIGLTAIWACLKGISEKSVSNQLIGERFRFIGNSKTSADIELTVFDEKTKTEVTIKNHITKQTNSITCEPVKDKNWLNELLSVAFLSAKNFTQLDSKKQAILLGIDTAKYDTELKSLKEEYTLLNRDYRNIGELVIVQETATVDIYKLTQEKQKVESEYYNKQKKIDEANRLAISRDEKIAQGKQKIMEIDIQLKELTDKKSLIDKWLKDNPSFKKEKDIAKPDMTEINKQIQNAEQINRQATEYETYLQKKKDKESKQKELNKNKEAQDIAIDARIKYIKSFKFSFEGLEVDDEGGLLLNGRPIKDTYFSKGELEIIVAKLHAFKNPELKTRFIDDFELLDDDNKIKLIDILLKEGFQVITAETGKESKGQSSILLRECKKVDEYTKKEMLL